MSDLFFALEITYCAQWTDTELLYIFVLSISCFVVPLFITLLQLHHATHTKWAADDALRVWLSDHDYALYMVCVLTPIQPRAVRSAVG